MTGKQLLNNALALLLTSSEISTDYGNYAVPLINQLLAEIAPYNEIVRVRDGKEPADSAMRIELLSDELPCEPLIAVMALPYGLCAKLLMDDDDMAKVAWFSNQFVAAAEACAGALAEPVTDRYPKGAAE